MSDAAPCIAVPAAVRRGIRGSIGAPAATRRSRRRTGARRWGGAALWVVLSAATVAAQPAAPRERGPLTLGLVFDYTGALGEYGKETENGVRLAVEQVNAGGGVLGRAVEVVVGDGATDPTRSVAVARELITERGADALIGPLGSAATIAVGREVSGPLQVPTISPSATATEITDLPDRGYLFRSVISDAAQGPALADLAREEGYERVAILYRNDAYGRGMAEAFATAYGGTITARVAIEPERSSYLPELRRAAQDRPQALIAISFPFEAQTYLPEAMDNGLFSRFLFSDTMLSTELLEKLGPERLEGFKGTAHSALLSVPSAGDTAFKQAYTERYAARAPLGPAAAAYDAAVCLCLAAEHARSTAGAAIRDALPVVCGGAGTVYLAGAAPIAAALAAVRRGEEVNYDGAATSVDWNADGDVTHGTISIWQFAGGGIKPLKLVTFDLRAKAERAAD